MTIYAVEFSAGFWHVRTDAETLVPLRMSGQPVAGFVTGWHARFVYTGFAPIYLLELVRDDGSKATWYLDETMNRLGGELKELSAETQALLAQKYLEVTGAPWQSLVLSQNPVWPPAVDGLSDVNAGTLMAISKMANRGGEEDVSWHDISNADASALAIQNGNATGSVQIFADHVKSILSIEAQTNFLAALSSGKLSWPSPVTGRPVTRVHGLYIDHMMILYRCVDDDTQLIFYVCCGGHHLQTLGVMFPTVRRAFYLTAAQRHLAQSACVNMMHRLMLYITRSGRHLPKYFSQQLGTFATPLWSGGSFHIGHHLWNELSGLMKIVTSVPAACYPKVIVLGNDGDGEAYGEVDRLFPELARLVVRQIPGDAEMVEFCCNNGIQIIRVTDSYVSKALRDRIMQLVRTSPNVEDDRILAQRLKQEGVPIVALGLRVENRTVVDSEAFSNRIVEYLEQCLGRVAVVIDGHNSRLRDGRAESYPSFTEARAAQPPTEVEKRIAKSLQANFRNGNVTVIDNIGATMEASLFWLDQSDFFISPWGAGLAKYRWVANKPGVVVSSKWVLQNKGDLHIYDDEEYMETPSDIRFIGSEHVFDFAEEAVLVQVFEPHHPMYYNFKLNMRALYKEIDKTIESIGISASHSAQQTWSLGVRIRLPAATSSNHAC